VRLIESLCNLDDSLVSSSSDVSVSSTDTVIEAVALKMMGVEFNVQYCSRAGSLWLVSQVRAMFCDDGIPKCGSESIDE
jgi:hypothetical protein